MLLFFILSLSFDPYAIMSFRLKHKKSSSETFGLKNPLLSTLKKTRPSLEAASGKTDIEVVVGIGNAIRHTLYLLEFCILCVIDLLDTDSYLYFILF